MNELMKAGSIEELVAHRDHAIEALLKASHYLEEAEKFAKLAAPSVKYSVLPSRTDLYDMMPRGESESHGMKECRKRIDQICWYHLRDAMGLKNLMDAQALKEFDRTLEDASPTFNVDNASATFSKLYKNQGRIFERGVLNVFRGLDTKNYKSNSAFKVNEKVVQTWALRDFGTKWGGSFAYGGHTRQIVTDLDRILHILDGKKPKSHLDDASQAVDQAARKNQGVVTTEYMSFKLFKNGNLHIQFTRPDLVAKVNKIIARVYKDSLADDSKAA